MEESEKIEAYYTAEHRFKDGIALLRNLAGKTIATETFKWHTPTYTVGGKNVFWISRFKNHFSIGFFNGVSLSDPDGLLETAQPGKTKAMRHWKFKSATDIDEKTVLIYMREAIENQEKELK
ncbi:DUF1801 domain-containing protein [Pricia sp. S334]|uniref:DUF1801 domain-containing protein n=1 Tax=Pricia mediterranea TaxID=3076079 RepID=A0ABU3L7M5_9FLAO|nr:DUF1801 domain-containing protein [Pricia sp. S334]MDT7829754.1 DUF1801 domain-containing protein [Pricia sp. S334]